MVEDVYDRKMVAVKAFLLTVMTSMYNKIHAKLFDRYLGGRH